MSDDQLDAICTEYLTQLEAALVDLSPGDRRQIVEQISEHIATARAALPEQTESGVRDILERLGSPEEIAAEAKAESTPPTHRDRRPILIAACVLVGLAVVGLAIAGGVGAFSSGGRAPDNRTASAGAGAGPMVTVPNVTGAPAPSAAQSLHSVGLKYVIRYTASSQPVGFVVQQSPSAGSVVNGAEEVTLFVSGTQNQNSVAVPNVVGQSEAQALATLQAAGLVVTTKGPVANSTVPVGIVFAQAPSAGSRVPSQSAVSLTISAGP